MISLGHILLDTQILKQPKNQRLIEQHNLLQALRDRGFSTAPYES
jgi:hypothetical protein